MKLYIKQKVFSWRNKFSIFDEHENDLFFAQGQFFSWGRKLHLFDKSGYEAAFIKQKMLTFMPRYIIQIDNQSYTLVKEFTFFKPCYHVENCGWTIEGDFWAHEYEIKDGFDVIMHISKHWFTWGDSYELDIPDDKNTLLALSIALAIDCVQADTNNGAANSAG